MGLGRTARWGQRFLAAFFLPDHPRRRVALRKALIISLISGLAGFLLAKALAGDPAREARREYLRQYNYKSRLSPATSPEAIQAYWEATGELPPLDIHLDKAHRVER